MFLILMLISGGTDSQAQQLQKGPAHVFITAGQSNTDGRVSNRLLPSYIKALSKDTSYNTGSYRFCKVVQNNTSGRFEPYWPKGRITGGLWTYDAIIYYLLEQSLKEDFYVVKYAVGGTSIGYPDDSSKGRYWSANPRWLAQTQSTEKGGKSLLLSFTETINAAIDQTLSKLDRGYQVDAFFWHQGESDDRYAGDYYDNLKAVVQYVRRHLTQKTGKDYYQLPFILGSIPKSNRHYKPEIEAAMQRLANEDAQVFLVDMSAGELQKDRTHFNERSAEYLGKEMYKIAAQQLDMSAIPFRIARYKDDKAAAISYTFDDGLKEHYTWVAPRLKQLGFKGTFWINGSKINDPNHPGKDTTRMTWAELKDMATAGHEISNHGWAHKNFGRFSLEEIREDIEKNDSAILANIGIPSQTFCYPNNTKTPEGIKLASVNRVGTRTEQRSVGGKSTHENLDKWVNELIRSRGWGVTMTHGIHYGYDHFSDPAILWEHLKKVKVLEDKIWVGTFKEVMAYTKERDAVRYTLKTKKDGIEITPQLVLDKALFNQPLTGVIDRPVKKVQIRQGKSNLTPRIQENKVLFNFDPFGGVIDVSYK